MPRRGGPKAQTGTCPPSWERGSAPTFSLREGSRGALVFIDSPSHVAPIAVRIVAAADLVDPLFRRDVSPPSPSWTRLTTISEQAGRPSRSIPRLGIHATGGRCGLKLFC